MSREFCDWMFIDLIKLQDETKKKKKKAPRPSAIVFSTSLPWLLLGMNNQLKFLSEPQFCTICWLLLVSVGLLSNDCSQELFSTGKEKAGVKGAVRKGTEQMSSRSGKLMLAWLRNSYFFLCGKSSCEKLSSALTIFLHCRAVLMPFRINPHLVLRWHPRDFVSQAFWEMLMLNDLFFLHILKPLLRLVYSLHLRCKYISLLVIDFCQQLEPEVRWTRWWHLDSFMTHIETDDQEYQRTGSGDVSVRLAPVGREEQCVGRASETWANSWALLPPEEQSCGEFC